MSTLYQTPKQKVKQERNRIRHSFLLTFFDPPHTSYTFIEKNGFILVRQFNKATDSWEVAIYTKEKWEKVQIWKQQREVNQEKLNLWKNP